MTPSGLPRCCAAGPRAARLADLPRILHTLARKLIAGALAVVAIAALTWRCASRPSIGRENRHDARDRDRDRDRDQDRDEDRDEDRDDDRDGDRDGDGDAELERIREQVRHRRPPPPPGRWLDVVYLQLMLNPSRPAR